MQTFAKYKMYHQYVINKLLFKTASLDIQIPTIFMSTYGNQYFLNTALNLRQLKMNERKTSKVYILLHQI